MRPTLIPGDHFIVNKLYSAEDIKRGDVIVFYQGTHNKRLVKRVIGLPGEIVQVTDNQAHINHIRLEEPYLLPADPIAPRNAPYHNHGPLTVPEQSLFVLGDNRANSADSRIFGFVNYADVIGKVTYIYWSWDKETGNVHADRIGTKVE